MQPQPHLSELTLLLQLPSSFVVHLIQTLTGLFVRVPLHRHVPLGHLHDTTKIRNKDGSLSVSFPFFLYFSLVGLRTSSCCCAFSRMRLFSLLSCWFSSCSLMMLFLAMANCTHQHKVRTSVEQKEHFDDNAHTHTCAGTLSNPVDMHVFGLWGTPNPPGSLVDSIILTSSMSLELDFSRESTLP